MRLFGYALLQRSRWSESPGLRPRAPIRVRPLSRSRLASADLFGQGDDDARRAAEVTEQEDALVLCHLAEEFGAVGAQAGGSAPAAAGAWYLVSSSLLWPSGVRIIAMSLRTPSSPTVRSAQRPSTCPLPSSSMPSSVKNATAASRSSTTMATLSIR